MEATKKGIKRKSTILSYYTKTPKVQTDNLGENDKLNETEVVVSLAESALTPFNHNSQSMSEQHNENNKLIEPSASALQTVITPTQIDIGLFIGQFEQEVSAIGEFTIWHHQVKNKNPKNATEAFINCNEEIFPTVHQLLKILITLPVTTASSERSFSSLRRLKTYLRNTTGENRLNGLAVMNIHRDLVVTTDEIIDTLALKNRRIKLV
ncbi:uncharacterized protein LOC111041726 [Myzus persicae]|uniref:uncharacterized protein LOC111041726 n=1 Tax=Myzus persicae TaxID=13164 RepID=UPI000B936D74|nr:uncharacterized protein LOC111041726 [Myzus persicae]